MPKRSRAAMDNSGSQPANKSKRVKSSNILTGEDAIAGEINENEDGEYDMLDVTDNPWLLSPEKKTQSSILPKSILQDHIEKTIDSLEQAESAERTPSRTPVRRRLSKKMSIITTPTRSPLEIYGSFIEADTQHKARQIAENRRLLAIHQKLHLIRLVTGLAVGNLPECPEIIKKYYG